MDSPEQKKDKKTFQLSWFLSGFTVIFLLLFTVLGFWQLNRAEEKTQLLATVALEAIQYKDINWQSPPLLRKTSLTGSVDKSVIFLLDNKTLNGRFGYEVWAAITTQHGEVLTSFGWVAGSMDRNILPQIQLPTNIMARTVTIRSGPKNTLLDESANSLHPSNNNIWVAQSFSLQWLNENFDTLNFIGFAQLIDAELWGVGPSIWQPTVMTPAKHRMYAIQWFSMALALIVMFLFASFRVDINSTQTKKKG